MATAAQKAFAGRAGATIGGAYRREAQRAKPGFMPKKGQLGGPKGGKKESGSKAANRKGQERAAKQRLVGKAKVAPGKDGKFSDRQNRGTARAARLGGTG